MADLTDDATAGQRSLCCYPMPSLKFLLFNCVLKGTGIGLNTVCDFAQDIPFTVATRVEPSLSSRIDVSADKYICQVGANHDFFSLAESKTTEQSFPCINFKASG